MCPVLTSPPIKTASAVCVPAFLMARSRAFFGVMAFAGSKNICIMPANKLARKRRTLRPMKTIGTIVREWREASGLTIADLVRKVGHGVRRQNIEQLEKDQVEQPKYLHHLAKLMGYTAEDLLARRKPPSHPGAPRIHSNSGSKANNGPHTAAVLFVSWQRIGDVVLLSNDVIDADPGPGVLSVGPMGPRVKATLVPDDSLSGNLARGTVVLLDPDVVPRDGDAVLVRMLDDTSHLRIYRALADGSFDVETTPPRVQSWNSVKHGLVVTAVVVAEYRNRRQV